MEHFQNMVVCKVNICELTHISENLPAKRFCLILPAFILSHPPENHRVRNLKVYLRSKIFDMFFSYHNLAITLTIYLI